MAGNGPKSEEHRERQALHLQPEEGVEAALVFEIERVAPAVHEARLAEDRDDLLELQLCGFEGRCWAEKERELFDYASRVLPKKIQTGEIFSIMFNLGVPKAMDLSLPKFFLPTREDCEDLAQEMTVIALPAFKELLKAGAWDPSREHVATMRSFFVGNCILRFRAPWRRWLRRAARQARLEHPSITIYDVSESFDEFSNPDRAAIAKLTLKEVFDIVGDPELKVILLRHAEGWTHQMIATDLNLSIKALRYRLNKAKKLARELGDLLDETA